MQLPSRATLLDKSFDIVIGAPLGAVATMLATNLWGWASWEPFAIGTLLFIAAVGILEAVRWERRVRPFAGNLRVILRNHATSIRAASGQEAQKRIRYAAGAIRAGIGEYAEKDYWRHISQFPTDDHPEPAAAYLEGLAARQDLSDQEPLSATL